MEGSKQFEFFEQIDIVELLQRSSEMISKSPEAMKQFESFRYRPIQTGYDLYDIGEYLITAALHLKSDFFKINLICNINTKKKKKKKNLDPKGTVERSTTDVRLSLFFSPYFNYF